jgi:hypothetical protein
MTVLFGPDLGGRVHIDDHRANNPRIKFAYLGRQPSVSAPDIEHRNLGRLHMRQDPPKETSIESILYSIQQTQTFFLRV